MFDDGDDDGVAHGVVGFVVGCGKFVAFGRSHEEGGFAGGDEAGGPSAVVVEEEELAAAAAFGGAEAAGEVVEAEFEDLFAVAGAAVAGESDAGAGGELVEQCAVVGGDDGEEGVGAGLVEDGGVPIDEVGEVAGARFGLGHGPPNGVVEGGEGAADGLGVEPVGAVVFERAGVEVVEGGDDEDAGARLGDPVAGVEQHGSDAVVSFAERLVEQAVVLPAVGGKQADDVFEGDDGGFFGHFIEDAEPLPEEATAGGGESAHFPSEGKILAGEAGPDDVAGRDLVALDLFDGTEVEMVVAMVGGVDGGLFRANVVRPDGHAGMTHTLGDQAAAGEEVDECGFWWRHAII